LESLLNRLADDYDLGTWISRWVSRPALSIMSRDAMRRTTTCITSGTTRFAGTPPCARHGQRYAGLIFTFGIFWSLLAMVFSARNHVVGIIVCSGDGMRYLMAIARAGMLSMIQSLSVVFAVAGCRGRYEAWRCGRPRYFGKTVVWRGERFSC